jgi:hypothetical protein
MSAGGLLLAIGNRGAGWDTNRWLLAEISNSAGAIVFAPRISVLGRSGLSAYFPSVPLAGPHFYWFADETVSVSAPISTVALNISSNACPVGVLPQVLGLPVPEKLLFYGLGRDPSRRRRRSSGPFSLCQIAERLRMAFLTQRLAVN